MDSVHIGYAGITWTINAELFSLEAKDFTAAFTYCLNWILTFILTFVYQDLSVVIYPYGTYFLFGSVCIFGKFTARRIHIHKSLIFFSCTYWKSQDLRAF